MSPTTVPRRWSITVLEEFNVRSGSDSYSVVLEAHSVA
jgi:hypothetical protein